MAEKDRAPGSGLPPEAMIIVIPPATLHLVSPPSRGLNRSCLDCVGAVVEGNRFHRSQPPENGCLLQSGILYGEGERGRVWFRVQKACFSEVGAQRPSTPLLTPRETAARGTQAERRPALRSH